MNRLLRLLPRLTVAFILLGGSLRAQQPAAEDVPDFYAGDPQLEHYVRQALERNPGIQQGLARYRAALQRVPQVTALPDPMLGFTQLIRSAETRVGPQLNVINLSQTFPWFGKLDLQGQVAFKEALAQYQFYRAQEREVIAQVKRAFYDLTYVDRSLEIREEERSILEHYEELAQTRYATGQGLQADVVKIQTEISRVLDRILLLLQLRESAVARLNTLMDRPPEDPVPAAAQPSLPQIKLDLDELYRLGDRYRQELKAAMARIERSEQAIELSKKDYWPNFTLSANLTNIGERSDLPGMLNPPPDNGKNPFGIAIGINIPIWRDKYRAGVLEATETLIANRREYLNVRNEMEFSVRDQVIRLETLQGQLELLEGVLIPQAEETLRATEAAYQTGQVGALELLDSERVLLELRVVQARYHADSLQAVANLERAVGTRFPR